MTLSLADNHITVMEIVNVATTNYHCTRCWEAEGELDFLAL